MVSSAVLALVVCPVCHGTLVMSQKVETVHCMQCKREYPVVQDIPVLIPERATESNS